MRGREIFGNPMKNSVFLGFALLGAAISAVSVESAPRARRGAKKAPIRLASAPRVKSPAKVAVKRIDASKLPKYVSMATIEKLRAQQAQIPALQPFWEGRALKRPMHDLLTGPAFDAPAMPKAVKQSKNRTLLAQVFPRPVAPAAVPVGRQTPAANSLPKWTRYPLEFQLCGIGLGSRAVDKDRFNRIDRYGLFALHGNPTAVVRGVSTEQAQILNGQSATLTVTTNTSGSATTAGNITLFQRPPEIKSLFPYAKPDGALPDWALAVAVQLDNNHVQWIYKRETFVMGFVVDRLGFVDAIIVAGVGSDISRTQLEDPLHTVKLGDDLSKVLFRYGYPDDVVPLAPDTPEEPGGTNSIALAANGTARVDGSGTDAQTGVPGVINSLTEPQNALYRTYDVRYEQSYNTVFTIRNNRVVRIYIFGDPDFFNEQRRTALRARY